MALSGSPEIACDRPLTGCELFIARRGATSRLKGSEGASANGKRGLFCHYCFRSEIEICLIIIRQIEGCYHWVDLVDIAFSEIILDSLLHTFFKNLLLLTDFFLV